jgi:hypothetical protein
MKKTKTKLRIKLILLSLVISLGLSTISFVPTASAETLKCEGAQICSATKDETECAGGYVKSPLSSDSTLVCEAQNLADQANTDLLNTARGILIFQSVLNRLIWPVLVMIGGLMDNSLLFGAGMQERLYSIWVPIRNLVNILFVVILVGIALYNILGIGDENSNYSLKTVLPQIIIGIILVNFSFTACKVILDGVTALTTSVFLIPGNVNEGLKQIIDEEKDEHKGLIRNICAHMGNLSVSDAEILEHSKLQQVQQDRVAKAALGDFLTKQGISDMPKTVEDMKAKVIELRDKKTDEGAKSQYDDALKKAEKEPLCDGLSLSNTGAAFLRSWNQRNAAFGLALNMGKIVFYQDLHFTGWESLDKTLVNSIMSMLLYLAYVGSFIALFLVLLARLIVLWLGIALSPILILIYGAPSIKDKLGSFGEIADQFMKNAIAPLLIAFALTVGWIMLHALQGMNVSAVDEVFPTASVGGIPVVGMSTIQDLITSCAVLGVVWVGVFSAAKGTIAESLTDKVKQAGESAAKWAGSIPLKHINMVPVKLPGKESENYSLSQVGDFLNKKFNDPQHDSKLTRDFNASIGHDALAGVNDGANVKKGHGLKYVKALEADLLKGDQTAIQRLKDLRGTNEEVYNEIVAKVPALRNAIPTDPAARITLGKELVKAADVAGATALKGSELKGGKPVTKPETNTPPKPAKPGQSAKIKDTTKVGAGGQTITQIAAASGGNAGALTTSYKGAMTSIEDLTATKDTTKKTELETLLKGTELRPGDVIPTAGDIETSLGKERYANLLHNIGSGDATIGKTKLTELLKAAAPPVPPAPPAPPGP